MACTRCPKGIHHTIIDPAFNTGVCTKTECPFFRPRSCCGKHSKHFVLNAESLFGVCVRHTDDCTPLCMPRGVDPKKKGVTRFCSKG